MSVKDEPRDSGPGTLPLAFALPWAGLGGLALGSTAPVLTPTSARPCTTWSVWLRRTVWPPWVPSLGAGLLVYGECLIRLHTSSS